MMMKHLLKCLSHCLDAEFDVCLYRLLPKVNKSVDEPSQLKWEDDSLKLTILID